MPALTAEVETINRRTQIGLETTAGTDVAANVLLTAMEVSMGVNLQINKQRAMGRRFPRIVTIGNEQQDFSYKGKPTFDEMIYPWAALWGKVTPVVQGTLGQRWITQPLLTGPQSANTLSIQQGDGVTRSQKVNFAILTDYLLKITNKDNDISGNGISHPIQDSITMTASPVVKAFQQITKPMWQLTLDPTSLAIGTTVQNTPLDVEFNYGSAYGPLYAINRSGQFKNVVDLEPKASIKVQMEADSQGMGVLPIARAGQLNYLRLQAVGNQIENTYFLFLGTGTSQAPTGGTFTLTYNNITTAGIAFGASASTIATALTGLSSVLAGNATVAAAVVNGLSGFIITFTGALASTNTLPVYNTSGAVISGFTASGALLTGGGIVSPLTPTAYLCQIDAAAYCTNIAKFSDSSGVFMIEYTFEFAEDPNWTAQGQASGQSSQLTLMNTLSSY